MEVERLVGERTRKILFETGLPNTDKTDFVFDDELTVTYGYIVIGKYFDKELIINLDENESIHCLYYKGDSAVLIFLNSSLSQFVQYIMLLADYCNKVMVVGRDGRHKYIEEWEKAMIEVDSDAFHDPKYWWGSVHEFLSHN